MAPYPDPGGFDSLVDLMDDAAERYPRDRAVLILRTDDGIALAWSAAELRHRSRLAAWRLRALGLEPGDRLLTWSPSTPRLPAVYWGAMRAGVIVVPLDLRMAPAVLQRIAERSGARVLAMDEGQDAPDPDAAGLTAYRHVRLADLTADPDDAFPVDWEARLDAWPRPTRESLFEVIYTSGTTSAPKGVMLTHGNILHTLDVCRRLLPPRHLRSISLLPLSHLFDQAPVLFYGTMLGAEITYVRSRHPRVIFEALREVRVNVMIVTPQVLDLFWTALAREVEKQGRTRTFERARAIARRLPYWARRLVFRRLHGQLGGAMRVFVCAGAYLPPSLQEAWEDLGIIVLQGYGSTECGPAAANSERHHPTGVVGRTLPPVRLSLAEGTSEILVAGPTVSPGYWQDPEATAAAFDADGWYHTGDVGRFNEHGELVLSGRTKNIIVLPNGFNVYPEDIEAVLLDHGLSQAVVLETRPGRIEAVVLPPGSQPIVRPEQAPSGPRTPEEEARLREEVERIVKAANRDLGVHQRLAGWHLWPDADFPRTHTFKVRRGEVAQWAAADVPLALRDTDGADDPADAADDRADTADRPT
jgi:long-chain acyl-CoA synthetase